MKTAHEQATKAATGKRGDEGACQCEYTPQDANYWAPDHMALRNLVVVQDQTPMGASALLDMYLELENVSRETLRHTNIRIQIRDAFGMSQLVWQGNAMDVCFSAADGSHHVLHASLKIQREILNKIGHEGCNNLHLILEDGEGTILDDALGQLRVCFS